MQHYSKTSQPVPVSSRSAAQALHASGISRPAADPLQLKHNNGYLARNIIQRHGPGFQNTTYVEADNVHLDRHLDVWSRYFPQVNTVDAVRGIARQLFNLTNQEDWINNGGSFAVDHSWGGQTVRLVWGLGGITSCFIVEPRAPRGTQQRGTQQRGAQPQPSYQQVNNSHQQPQTIYQQPYPSYQQVNSSHQQPQTTYQQPYPSYQQVNNSHQQPQTTYQQPQPSYQQLNNSQQQTTYQTGLVTHNGYYWTHDYSSWWDPATNLWRARIEQGRDWYYA
ncbi:hypothetical protein [Chitinophaga tropicalis]|uniref:Uncharacterized protein n=1 Tax=Chitinophaga tropicalis TaxID=2683588 RepID=A0A7K1U7H3_9BACT|nr:hypothetical protein [Chitinophaga tropicalis]MVT10299.1 hypothetical protein [Chitinophaga tropicalis]